MARNLKTDWLTIGRSGPTVDGREISPQAILDMAETYDRNLYAALIWPEHFRWANFGAVDKVRSTKNNEGGYDLQAVLAPNEFYLNSNSFDQRLYLSMEILPDFRGTKKPYLTGLGATDSPASVATSEVRFSKEGTDTIRAKPEEITLSQHLEKTSLFNRLFGSADADEEDEVNKEMLTALLEELKGLRTEFTALKTKPDDKPADPPPADPNPDKFAALEKKIDDLAAQFSAQPPAPDADQVKALAAKLDDLEKKFTAALAEAHPGTTKPPAQTGADGDRKDYL